MIAANHIHSLWIALLGTIMLCLEAVIVPPQFIPSNLNHITMLVLVSYPALPPEESAKNSTFWHLWASCCYGKLSLWSSLLGLQQIGGVLSRSVKMWWFVAKKSMQSAFLCCPTNIVTRPLFPLWRGLGSRLCWWLWVQNAKWCYNITVFRTLASHWNKEKLDVFEAVVLAQWQSTGCTSQVSWVRFPAAAGLFTFLYFRLKNI